MSTELATSYDEMNRLLEQMRKSKGDSGYAVFMLRRGVPVAMPLRGRPRANFQAAIDDGAFQLETFPNVTMAAWVVDTERGITEVHTRARPTLRGRGVVDTHVVCPLCDRAGYRTIGGDVPTLKKLALGDDGRTFCVGRHGYTTEND